MKMENKKTINKKFELTEEQIKFIDQRFINNNKCEKLEEVVRELIEQQDNNFQEEDIAQIMESYLAIKRQKVGQYSKEWSQEELKTLKDAIEKNGSITNINAFAKDLKKNGLFKSRSVQSICQKIFKLKNNSPEEHSKIRSRNEWTEEELETLKNKIKTEIEEKGSITNVNAFVRDLKKNRLFESRDEESICRKIHYLKNKSLEEHSKIKSKDRWTEEELNALKGAIEKKGETISIRAFAKDLKKNRLFESRDEESICRKIHYLKNKSLEEHSKIEGKNGKDLVQEEPKTLDDDLLRELGESLDKYIKNIENNLKTLNQIA